MVRVIWLPQALARIDLIRAYVAQFDPVAAQRLAERLLAAGNSLAEFPGRGRLTSRGRRELTTVAPYVLRYRVLEDRIYVTDIKHGRQARD